MTTTSALERLLAEVEAVGLCLDCRKTPASTAEWERHTREYPGECPTQAFTGDCWCLQWCWCEHPETDGASARERRLAAIVRALQRSLEEIKLSDVGGQAGFESIRALAKAERLARGEEG